MAKCLIAMPTPKDSEEIFFKHKEQSRHKEHEEIAEKMQSFVTFANILSELCC
jgi:hypothetical protein